MADLDSTLQKVFLTSELAYRELIKVHLSRLIEIDSGFDFDRIYQTSTVHAGRSSVIRFFFSKFTL